jgi:hypothetical protein
MKVRHNHIHFRRGQQTFAVRRTAGLDPVRFIGSINGIECGAWQPDRHETCTLCVKRSYRRSGDVSY